MGLLTGTGRVGEPSETPVRSGFRGNERWSVSRGALFGELLDGVGLPLGGRPHRRSGPAPSQHTDPPQRKRIRRRRPPRPASSLWTVAISLKFGPIIHRYLTLLVYPPTMFNLWKLCGHACGLEEHLAR